jgi:hypothetical protein
MVVRRKAFLRRGYLKTMLSLSQIARAGRANRVEVLLRGGLGNQLFGYAAGLELSHRTGLPLSLVTSFLRANDSDTARSFELGELVAERVTVAAQGSNRCFTEQSFAFDENFLALDGPTLLDGYFQSSRYFSSISELLREQIRQTPSFSAGRESMGQSPFIGVQFRRGDYRGAHQANFHGLVNDRYFLRGVELVRSIVGNLPVVVFSDEYKEAVRLASTIVGAEAHCPRPDGNSIETLGALSEASSLVISNSTFGWWGAYLGDSMVEVVVPRPWFKNRGLDTTDLIERTWISIGY